MDPGISVCDSTCGRNGREQTRLFDLDCLRSTSKQVKLVGYVLKALGLSPHSKMFQKKKKCKKAQLVTGWPGFSLHFKEMTYIIFTMNQKRHFLHIP